MDKDLKLKAKILTNPESHQSNYFEIKSLIAVLIRQARVILLVFLVLFGLAFGFLVFTTETYTATALILTDPDQKDILNPRPSTSSSAGRENAKVDSEV